MIGGAGSLFGLTAGGGPAAFIWAGCGLVLLAATLALTEQILEYRRGMRETRRGSARDEAAGTVATAAAAGRIAPWAAAAVLDAQSRREAVVAGLAAGADPAELARIVRALQSPQATGLADRARPRRTGGTLPGPPVMARSHDGRFRLRRSLQ